MARRTLPNPCARLDDAVQRRVLWIALVVLAAAVVGLALSSPALFSTAAPFGIVSWQLATDASSVSAILAEWGEAGQRAARTNLLVDLAFAPAYGITLALLAMRLAGRLGAGTDVRQGPGPRTTAPDDAGPWRFDPCNAGAVAVWAALLAAGADTLENLLMLRVLSVGPSDLLAMLTVGAAVVKFVALAVAIGLVIGLGVAVRRARLDPR